MDSNRIEAQLLTMEARLERIEQELNITPKAEATGWHEESSTLESSSVSETVAVTDSAPKSGNWLGLIAVVCFVFAAGFIIKLSIESGWLTPERQVVIAALFGVSLIVTGFFLINTYRGYASLLPAAGIIILFLSAFAAHRYYNLVSFNQGLVLATLVSAVCVWLYFKIRHDIYAVTAALGTYLSPIILGFDTRSLFSVYYFLCCSLAFAALSIWVRSRTMTVVAAYLAILITSIIGLSLQQDYLIVMVLALHFFIFSLGTYIYTLVHHQHLTEKEAWGFFPVLMLFYAMEYFYINRIHPDLAPWISLGFAGLLIVLYLSAKKWFPEEKVNSESMIFAFASVVVFHSFYLELVPIDLKPWLFVILILAMVFLPIAQFTSQNRRSFYVPALTLGLILILEYCKIVSHLLDINGSSWLLVAGAAFASIWLLFFYRPEFMGLKNNKNFILLGAAHLLAVTGLYRLADPYGSLSVSACWLFYALVIMGVAYQRKDKLMAKSALTVLGFAAGKALLYDAASTPTTVRIFCLLLTGAVLYGAGFFMKKIAEWKE